jgi:hypothetical protein
MSVLLLHGMGDKPGQAVAMNDIGVLAVSYETFKKIIDSKGDMKGFLVPKIAHEGMHVLNHKADPDMSPLLDEAKAYEATYESAALLHGKNSDIAIQQKLVSDAFNILAGSLDKVAGIFGINENEVKNINYKDINIQDDFVVVGLYNMKGGAEKHIGVGIDNQDVVELQWKK